jgi:hypothetical protein
MAAVAIQKKTTDSTNAILVPSNTGDDEGTLKETSSPDTVGRNRGTRAKSSDLYKIPLVVASLCSDWWCSLLAIHRSATSPFEHL